MLVDSVLLQAPTVDIEVTGHAGGDVLNDDPAANSRVDFRLIKPCRWQLLDGGYCPWRETVYDGRSG